MKTSTKNLIANVCIWSIFGIVYSIILLVSDRFAAPIAQLAEISGWNTKALEWGITALLFFPTAIAAFFLCKSWNKNHPVPVEEKGAKKNDYVKTLCVHAAMVALFVVLDVISIKAGDIKITFGGLPIILCAILYGPISGTIVGLLGSFIGQLICYGISATTPLWILPAAIRGLSMGLLYRAFKRNEEFKVLGAEIIATSLLVTVLNTVILYLDSIIVGYPYAAVLWTTIVRFIASVLTAIAYSYLISDLLKAIRKGANLPGGNTKDGKKTRTKATKKAKSA